MKLMGESVHRASAEIAQGDFLEAASFSSAVKRLENLYTAWLNAGGPERCSEKSLRLRRHFGLDELRG